MTPSMSPLQSWAFLALLLMLAVTLVVVVCGVRRRLPPRPVDVTDLNRVDRLERDLRRTEALRRMGGRR